MQNLSGVYLLCSMLKGQWHQNGVYRQALSFAALSGFRFFCNYTVFISSFSWSNNWNCRKLNCNRILWTPRGAKNHKSSFSRPRLLKSGEEFCSGCSESPQRVWQGVGIGVVTNVYRTMAVHEHGPGPAHSFHVPAANIIIFPLHKPCIPAETHENPKPLASTGCSDSPTELRTTELRTSQLRKTQLWNLLVHRSCDTV